VAASYRQYYPARDRGIIAAGMGVNYGGNTTVLGSKYTRVLYHSKEVTFAAMHYIFR